MRDADVIVAGGGPAGSAAAARLAEAGARVILVERTEGPHDKVCGEFVSGDAWKLLADLGLGQGQTDAVPIRRMRLVRGQRTTQATLPFAAAGLSRRSLDERLLDTAGARGAEIIRGRSVRTAVVIPGGVAVSLSSGAALTAQALFLATGKHELRGHARPPAVQNRMIGLKTWLDLTPAAARTLEGEVWLLLFEGGYAGLQPVGDNRANLCLLVTRDRYQAFGRSWPRLLSALAAGSPLLADCLAGARLHCAGRPLAIYGIPFGHVAQPQGGRIFRLGDQMAVIPSFAGNGIAMALWSGRRAADTFLTSGADSARWHALAARRFGPRVRAAAWTARALERPSAQALAMTAAGAAPSLLGWAAAATRLAQ